jgi:pyridoxine 5-phosphate synthase
VISKLKDAGIRVSLFVEPDPRQLDASAELGADIVELHTGRYCDVIGAARDEELKRIADAANYTHGLGMECHAGHGLTFDTVSPVASLPEVVELNIGHFLIGEAIFLGLDSAIQRMRALMEQARAG